MGTRLRVSGLMLIAVLAVLWRVQDLTTSALLTAVLFSSVLLHDLAHVWLSHRRLVPCPERILWPFGGLFGSAPRRPDLVVNLAGPAVSLVLALVAASQLDVQSEILPLVNPATCWQAIQSDNLLAKLSRICFFVNTVIVAANLIPVRPMAAGYVLQSLLVRRYSEMESRDLLLRTGLVVGILGLLAGFVLDLSGVAAVSAFLLLLHVQEAVQWFHSSASERDFNRYADSLHDGEMNHDEENPDEFDGDYDIPGSVVDRWKNRRESERILRERDLEQREHEELDRVLEKLHTQGRDSLTITEVRLLNCVSAKLRQKNH